MVRMIVEIEAHNEYAGEVEAMVGDALDYMTPVRAYWIHLENEYPNYLDVTAGGAVVSGIGPGNDDDDFDTAKGGRDDMESLTWEGDLSPVVANVYARKHGCEFAVLSDGYANHRATYFSTYDEALDEAQSLVDDEPATTFAEIWLSKDREEIQLLCQNITSPQRTYYVTELVYRLHRVQATSSQEANDLVTSGEIEGGEDYDWQVINVEEADDY